MFRSKYIFESRETRFIRRMKAFLFAFAFSIVSFIVFCFLMLSFSKTESTLSDEIFYNKSPDLIAVFTGDYGRILYAITKAQEYKNAHLFISGVYNKNTINNLLPADKQIENIDTSFIEIDYHARNTLENVISTLRFLKENKHFKKILIVSSDYHILRSKMILNKLKDDGFSDTEFNYYGINTDYTKISNLKKIAFEALKIFRTYAILLLWVPDSVDNIETI